MTSDDKNDDKPHAIAVVGVGGYRSDGSPVPCVDTAICNVCGTWATRLRVAGRTTSVGDFFDRHVSRRETVVVYACDAHDEQVADALVDEFGGASNRLDHDELARAVDRMGWGRP